MNAPHLRAAAAAVAVAVAVATATVLWRRWGFAKVA
jgi:hypothetical protein